MRAALLVATLVALASSTPKPKKFLVETDDNRPGGSHLGNDYGALDSLAGKLEQLSDADAAKSREERQAKEKIALQGIRHWMDENQDAAHQFKYWISNQDVWKVSDSARTVAVGKDYYGDWKEPQVSDTATAYLGKDYYRPWWTG